MEETIQVKMSYLNKLLDQTGEVIINGTRLAILEKEVEDGYIHQQPVNKVILNMIKQISLSSRQIANNLHKNVMDIRQVEFKETLLSIQRLIRDLSKSQGKTIKLKFTGAETMVDKAIIEELSGPLIHIIRNAVDHGIEPGEERQMKNKPVEGNVAINVYKKERFINIEIIDDGGGIDMEKVCRKAVSQGLIEEERLSKLSDNEKYSFIFLPGFSTKDKVSELSGRGVGMDVVKTAIEKLNGFIYIDSKINAGTKFSLKIPMISAVNITDALLICVEKSTYAIPISSVVATISVNKNDLKSVDSQETILFRNKPLMIYDLNFLLKKKSNHKKIVDIKNIVIIKDREDMIGIKVDKLLPPQKIVVKILDEFFGKVYGICGTTLLSADNVGLIIDVPELVSIACGRELAVKGSGIEKSAFNSISDNAMQQAGAGLKEAPKPSAIKNLSKNIKKLKVEIDAELDTEKRQEIALNYEGKLLDAFNSGKPVYEITFKLENDIIKSQKSKLDLYKMAKSLGDLLCIVPMTGHIPENFKDFSPLNFDMSIKFFLLSHKNINELSQKFNIKSEQIRSVGITLKEELETAPEEKIFNEVEVLEDYEAFAIDTKKNITMLTESSLLLEQDPSNIDAIHEIFRAVHTLKSASAMLGIKNMADISHEFESMLDKIRNGIDVMTPEKLEVLFDVIKFYDECMKSIQIGIKPVISCNDIKERILKFKTEIHEKKVAREIDVKAEKFVFTHYEKLVIEEKISKNYKPYCVLVEFIPDLPMKMVNAFMLFKSLKEYGDIIKTIPTMEEIEKGNFELYFKFLFLSEGADSKFKELFTTEEIKSYEISDYEER